MNNNGWVKLWRKSIDKGWLKDHKLWTLWTWCLMKASHKEHTTMIGLQEITLKPGQFVFGRHSAVKELSMTEREFRTRIDSLKKAENLTIKTTNKFSIGTVANWERYQGDESENVHQNDQQVSNKGPQTRSIYTCEFFSVPQKEHEKYLEAYPGLDLLKEYKKMNAWLEANPKKRKTKRGYPRFRNNWLSKAYTERKPSSDWRDDLEPI